MVIDLNDNQNNNSSSFNFKEFASWLFSLSGLDFSIIGSITGVLIASNLSVNEQNTIGNFLELVGQVLLTINAQEITRLTNIQNPNNLSIQDLNNKIEFIYNELLKIKREPLK